MDMEVFSPTNTTRRFKIALPDLMVDLIWLPLRKIIQKQAPGLDLLAVPLYFKDRDRLLSDGKADIVICLNKYLATTDRKTKLMEPNFVCAMRKGHPLADKPLTLPRFLSAEHLLVTASGEDRSYVDELLNNKGKSRRVALTINHYSALPKLLIGSDLITVVDKLAVAKEVTEGNIIIKKAPLDIEKLPLCIAWHARHDRDKMLHWLKDIIIQVIQDSSSLSDHS